MDTSFEESDSSIGLMARSLYNNDDSDSHTGSYISASERLLEDGPQYSDASLQKKPEWRTLLSFKRTSKLRRKPSRLRSDTNEKTKPRRRNISRRCLKFGVGILVLLGLIQLFSLIGSLILLFLPDEIHRILGSWGRPGHIGAGLSSWPTDFTRDILPKPCHSHNDYWRTVPLFSAIEAGCIGVEADVWLFNEELYVGHSVASLTPNRTLNSLYINPLLDILSGQNPKRTLIPNEDPHLHGVFDTTPEQSLIFLIDFKTAGDALWPYVQSAMEPLRAKSYLTHTDGSEIIPGPITVVGTGNTPFSLVDSDDSNPHRDIFFDAPLDNMYEGPNLYLPGVEDPTKDPSSEPLRGVASSEVGSPTADGSDTKLGKIDKRQSDEAGQGRAGASTTAGPDQYTANNSYYASVDFNSAIGHLAHGQFSDHQLELLRGQIRGAHRRGLKARYWDLPFWPISLRNHVWNVLVREGVDLLNVDDLKGATRRNWNRHQGWWGRMKGSSYTVSAGVNGSV